MADATTFKSVTRGLMARGHAMVDALFPPGSRQELQARLQAFAASNPKLCAFLLANVTLTGIPLMMFIAFSITVFVFSLVAALLIAVLVALLFTVFCVGVALLIVLPTVFATTMVATFLFLWGIGGYYILKWFDSTSPAKPGEAIGDKLNTITGGRLDFLMQKSRNPSQQRTGVQGEKGTDDEKEGLMNSAVDGDSAKAGTTNVQNTTTSIDASKCRNVTNGVQSKEIDAAETAIGAAGETKGAIPGSTGLG